MRRRTTVTVTARLAAPALAVLLSLGLAACGGGSDKAGSDKAGKGDTKENSANSDYEKSLKFAKCMRDNGITDYPDPKPAKDGQSAMGITIDGSDPKFMPAMEKCRPLLPNGGKPDPKKAEEARKRALEFARCMRKNGITDYPDPGSNAQPPLPDPSDPAYAEKSRKFDEATRACGGPGGAIPAMPAQ